MKKIRWIQISVTALLASQAACSTDDSNSPVKKEAQSKIEKFTKANLDKLSLQVGGRTRCACQQLTRGGKSD